MRYSIKHSFAAVAFVALLLAALVSKSPAFIEIASITVSLAIPLALVFAICDSNQRRRLFWIGFFILSISSFLFCMWGDLFSTASWGIAELLCGNPEMVLTDPSTLPPQATASLPQGMELVSVQMPSKAYNNRMNLLADFAPRLLSVVFGIAGGMLALWIGRTDSQVSGT